METHATPQDIFLFPLGTVLFPDGPLPLKIFEQRYVEMTKACLRDNLAFGVCLIREGREVGTPALPHEVGCLARIEQWEMPSANMFHLLARGGERFRVVKTSVAANGLISASVEVLAAPAPGAPDAQAAALLQRIIDQVGAENFPQPLRLDDGAWVAYRIAEALNFPMPLKQQLLESAEVSQTFAEITRAAH